MPLQKSSENSKLEKTQYIKLSNSNLNFQVIQIRKFSHDKEMQEISQKDALGGNIPAERNCLSIFYEDAVFSFVEHKKAGKGIENAGVSLYNFVKTPFMLVLEEGKVNAL